MNKRALSTKYRNSMCPSMIKKTAGYRLLLFLMQIIFLHSANALELSVPIGSTGYLGEVTPPVGSITLKYGMVKPVLEANMPYVSFRWEPYRFVMDTLPFYPEIGRVGVAIYNKNNPKGAFIVLAPSGYGLLRYKRANGTFENASFSFSRSETTSMTNMYNNFPSTTKNLAWGLFPRQGNSNFFSARYVDGSDKVHSLTLTISSYSAYAIGPLEAGEYAMREDSKFYANISTSPGSSVDTKTLLSSTDNVNIKALKACDVIPQTTTNIQFPTQIAKNYATPTKLADNLASISVNCPYANKNIYLTLSPFNNLVSGSETGMELSTSSTENITTLPYVVASLKSAQSNICQANAQDALRLVGSNKLAQQNMKSFTQNIIFNLCANGNIKANKYTGAINVAILIE
ncbi:hypothetical protein [Proteus mirabilis]|uniref:hypothetical protein n=3 Tax=Proteus mirabilis TaxID=584 RepID=UPI000F5CF7D0|nr:hypothetical protein [Proteus mirabilis]AZG98305.1 hypothetical protein EHQ66_07000 [Proteus mirabilis]MCI9766504.1 hypothetical protein [Proteus mirabilis]MCI9770091.1 hypothetical protein [Proteus mirabilis]MCI9773685.1 hypothetical protein [Proteus mirabilis]HBC8709829.1 hypothetical protein [Proteus mirabilis]